MIGCSQQDCRRDDVICTLDDELWDNSYFITEKDYLDEMGDIFHNENETENIK